MKQTIVLIATVALGLFIYGIIQEFKAPVQNSVDQTIITINKDLPGAAGGSTP